MKAAATVDLRSHSLHWHDEETRAFVKFWFDGPQRRALTRLAYVIDRRRRRRPSEQRRVALDAISIALSRLIVTKEQGASLARDTSHSRPHSVADTSAYDVDAHLVRSVQQPKTRLLQDRPLHPARMRSEEPRVGKEGVSRW